MYILSHIVQANCTNQRLYTLKMFVFSLFVCVHRGRGNRVNVPRTTDGTLRRFYPVTAFCEQYIPNLRYVTIERRVEARRREMMEKTSKQK
jgi:hypothetical protein